MIKKILVTGGAGFIGSFLVDRLVKEGYQVRVLDSLEPQVHVGRKPDYLNGAVEYLWGDCGKREIVAKALEGMDAVYHMAALVGVGQSMYEIERYTHGNNTTTAVLLEELLKMKPRPAKMIVASSMSIYGEGAYKAADGRALAPELRPEEQLKRKQWEVLDPETGQALEKHPTPEDKPLKASSVYAMSKRYQEELFMVIGYAYGIPSVACRFFNAYGSRQSLNNPYTGVAAIFSSRLLQGLQPIIFEDGNQVRDFVHVTDLVQGLYLCLIKEEANHEVFNLGSGQPVSINQVAHELTQAITGGKIQSIIAEKFRAGDIRHCYADISKAQRLLGYKPAYTFKTGVPELVEWVKHQRVEASKMEQALAEAQAKGIVI